jgi:hypothetical protein
MGRKTFLPSARGRRAKIPVCRECANSAKQNDTVKHCEIIDQHEILMNQYGKELTETEENKLNEIRN